MIAPDGFMYSFVFRVYHCFFYSSSRKKKVRIADPRTYLQAMLNFISVEYETLRLAAYRLQR